MGASKDTAAETSAKPASDDEDDYMTMSFGEPDPAKSTSASSASGARALTSLQRRKERERQAFERGRNKSKAEIAAEAERAREAALDQNILHRTTTGTGAAGSKPVSGAQGAAGDEASDSTVSKGARMMKLMGYKAGEALGKQQIQPKTATPADNPHGVKDAPSTGTAGTRPAATQSDRLLEPLRVEVKDGREGIGLLSEKKRKFREEQASHLESNKRREEDEQTYRARVLQEREEKRAEGQWWGGMKVLEGFHDGDNSGNADGEGKGNDGTAGKGTAGVNPRQVPLLVRPLWYERAAKEREQRQRSAWNSLNLVRRARTGQGLGEEDPEMDADDRLAIGAEESLDAAEEEANLPENDEELQGYLDLAATQRVEKIVAELREKWTYCFWCKYRYKSKEEMEEECPGKSEDDHG